MGYQASVSNDIPVRRLGADSQGYIENIVLFGFVLPKLATCNLKLYDQ